MNKYKLIFSKKINFIFLIIFGLQLLLYIFEFSRGFMVDFMINFEKSYGVFLSFFSIYFGVLITLNITFPNQTILEKKLSHFAELYKILMLDIALLVLYFIMNLMHVYTTSIIVDMLALSLVLNIIVCLIRVVIMINLTNKIVSKQEKNYYSDSLKSINEKVNYIYRAYQIDEDKQKDEN